MSTFTITALAVLSIVSVALVIAAAVVRDEPDEQDRYFP